MVNTSLSLCTRNDEEHPIAIKLDGIVASGWLTTADSLSEKYCEDIAGRKKIPVFVGITRYDNSSLVIPSKSLCSKIFESNISDIWLSDDINVHPECTYLSISEKDIMDVIGDSNPKIEDGIKIFPNSIPKKEIDNLVLSKSWFLVLDASVSFAKKAGATHCVVKKMNFLDRLKSWIS